MAWIESHQELRDNPKTRKLARALNISIPTAIGHLQCLWWWALDYAQDGDLSKYDDYDIADAMMWEGDPPVLAEAMVAARLIEEDVGGRRIHDWREYAGRLIERREKDRERKRNAAAARGGLNAPAGNSAGTPKEILRNEAGTRKDSGVTVPYRTVPYSTAPKDQGQDHLPGAGNPAPGGSSEKEPDGGAKETGDSGMGEADPAVIELPLNDKSLYPVTESMRREWQALYPAIDVMQELRAMLGWLNANPANRKTRKGAGRFANGWLSRAQNRARASPAPSMGRASNGDSERGAGFKPREITQADLPGFHSALDRYDDEGNEIIPMGGGRKTDDGDEQ
jgi:hypothetical protein